jgi:FolB domain-containing protein
LDIEMGIDCQIISQDDRIHSTIDYVTLTTQLTNLAATLRCELIETLVEKIADYIHQHYPAILYLKLSLEKPGAISGATVGVVIERNY